MLLLISTLQTIWHVISPSPILQNNLRQTHLAKQLYYQTCEQERKILRNFQRILHVTPAGMSLSPFFPEGYTSIQSVSLEKFFFVGLQVTIKPIMLL